MIANNKAAATDEELIKKVVDGNPGALSVVARFYKFMGRRCLESLDGLDIRGGRIWMLYKDVCKGDFAHMSAVLAAVELHRITKEQLNHAIDHGGEGIDVEALHGWATTEAKALIKAMVDRLFAK